MPKTLFTALSIIDRENYYKRFDCERKDFTWLMEMLLGPNDRVKGCEIIFPDTVLFKNGKPIVVIKMDLRDYCIYGLRSDTKLNLQNIYKDFQNVTRERKKDVFGIFVSKYGADIQQTGEDENKGFDFQTDDKNAKMQALVNQRRATYKDLRGLVFEQRTLLKREDTQPSHHEISVVTIPDPPEKEEDHDDEHAQHHHHHTDFSDSADDSHGNVQSPFSGTSKFQTREDKHHRAKPGVKKQQPVNDTRSIFMKDVAIIRYI